MPDGPLIVDDPHVALPPKEACYNQMEAMIYHFKLIMDGIQVPEGEIYSMVEGANGELGFYTISDGTQQAVPQPLPAALLPDLLHLPPPDQRRLALRRHRLAGRPQHHRRRARTMSQPSADPERRPRCRGGPVLRPDAPYPTERKPYKPGLAERLYLPLLRRPDGDDAALPEEPVRPSKMYTIEYPEERRDYSHRFRGHHILTTRPDGSVRCVACFLCAQNCPAECIHIEAGEHPDVNIEKYPVVYEIDMLRCIFCGYCVDACPEEAIIMSNNYDMAYFTREQSIVGKTDLMKPYTFDENQLGYRPRFPEEDVQRAKMRRDAFNLVEAAQRRPRSARRRKAARG